jgi:hypothetical protein
LLNREEPTSSKASSIENRAHALDCHAAGGTDGDQRSARLVASHVERPPGQRVGAAAAGACKIDSCRELSPICDCPTHRTPVRQGWLVRGAARPGGCVGDGQQEHKQTEAAHALHWHHSDPTGTGRQIRAYKHTGGLCVAICVLLAGLRTGGGRTGARLLPSYNNNVNNAYKSPPPSLSYYYYYRARPPRTETAAIGETFGPVYNIS